MPRILFLSEYLTGGGAEKVLANLVRFLDPAKFDITVQSIWKQDPAGILPPHVRYRSCYPKTEAGRLRCRIEAQLGLSYPLRIRDDYDLEVAFLEYSPTKILAAGPRRAAKRVAWVHCDLEKATLDPADLPKVEAWYHQYDRVVCVSRSVQAVLDRLFRGTVPSVVLHNVIDDEEICRKAAEPVELPDGDRPVVCTVGRLDVPKNHLRLLRAHERLLAEGCPHQLWIVGDGSCRSMLEAFIAERHLADSAKLLGFRENPYGIMRRAELLACSSDYEGLSTFVTEGLVLGKPIVTTDCGGMDELLGDSEYGLITAVDDDAFTDGLRRMLTDSVLRENYAARAAIRGRDFTARALAGETEQYLIKLLEE